MKPKPLDKRKRIVLYVLINLAAIACVPLFFVYKRIAAAYPQLFACTLYEFFGLYCPGCGTTRALDALVHGRLFTAVRANPGAVMSAAYLLWIDIKLGISTFKSKPFIFGRPERVSLIVIAAVLVLWAIIRNLILIFCGYDLLGGIAL